MSEEKEKKAVIEALKKRLEILEKQYDEDISRYYGLEEQLKEEERRVSSTRNELEEIQNMRSKKEEEIALTKANLRLLGVKI